MTRVLFTLSMPGRSSWNGKWSGDGQSYTIVRKLSDRDAGRLFATEFGHTASKSFSYAWPDGWVARVDARIMITGEKVPKSAGFRGYDWMVDSIITRGRILADHEVTA